MDLLKWSRRPAEGVAATTPQANVLRGLLARATTPLLPDDYLHLLNPLWSARELRGRIVSVHKETTDSATVEIETGWGFSHDYRPGQYVGIGVQIGGRWHWRSYSLTSIGASRHKRITVTVKANPDGFLSTHLVDGLEPGTVIRLAPPRGDFVLPSPPPPRLLFITAGSGITPVMSMLRSLRHRGTLPDVVHVHSAPTRDDVIFADELAELSQTADSYTLHLQLTREMGKVELAGLDDLVPDWRERSTWACGPVRMLDDVEHAWTAAGLADELHIERFAIDRGGDRGEGGTLTFSRSGRSTEIDGATTILEAGEALGVALPFGCRMGICQSCVVPLESGHSRDLRSGEEHREGERIQTCVSTVSGECTIDL
ncbi:ferredoxin reductase [Williamsia deligens]|uniref:Ferredoxin reductase n=1 Tax=Williamsia deligens TaxID=321325 RepID=A0ABW3GAS7_9NOCA|nr:ferredoxin reductase [Williamsia deligens]MCP2195175.1 Ferredoxin-NADP reductase [Williamsia deligens]